MGVIDDFDRPSNEEYYGKPKGQETARAIRAINAAQEGTQAAVAKTLNHPLLELAGATKFDNPNLKREVIRVLHVPENILWIKPTDVCTDIETREATTIGKISQGDALKILKIFAQSEGQAKSPNLKIAEALYYVLTETGSNLLTGQSSAVYQEALRHLTNVCPLSRIDLFEKIAEKCPDTITRARAAEVFEKHK